MAERYRLHNRWGREEEFPADSDEQAVAIALKFLEASAVYVQKDKERLNIPSSVEIKAEGILYRPIHKW